MLRSPARFTRPLVCGMLAMLAFSCTPALEPGHDAGVQLAKTGGGGPTVSSVIPSWAHQGDANVSVQILGSGFDQGSVASWERNGVADPKITVQQTRFVSSSELVATISVAGDAAIDFYDVAVTTSTRKKGIGMESFAVTAAQSIGTLGGNTLARAVNDQGAAVGYSMAGTSQHAFLAAAGASMLTDLGAGQAYDIDPTGSVVVGVSGAGVVWRQSSGWAASPLPDNGAGSRAVSMAATAGGLLIGGSVENRLSRTKLEDHPALWRESGTSWALQTLPIPSGFAGGYIEDVNGNGQAVGYGRDPYSKAYLWEADGTAVPLPSLSGDRTAYAYGIDPAGTIIVGQSGSRAVYWKRNGSGQWTASVLESCGRAMDVNGSGLIVGQGCANATLWRLNDDGTVTTFRLPGLGANSDTPAVEAINNAASPLAAGKAKQQGSSVDEGVIWNLNVELGQ
jgi:probable HAF family extracellular repeat protein